MRFNIAYFGPPAFFNLRRDFMLALKYGLESLGHKTYLSGTTLHDNCINLIIGAYFLTGPQILQITSLGVRYVNINTEVIKDGMLNFQPAKVDLEGVYFPFLKKGVAAWDVIQDNMGEYAGRGVANAHFLRWGWLPELEEIKHEPEFKDLDFYFFGSMTERRQRIVAELRQRGLQGMADGECPYFVRNDRIARARVQLNLVQADIYTHVNSFRICYLANNRCAILSEKEEDPAGYLEYADVAPAGEFADRIVGLIANNAYLARGEAAYEKFRKVPMKDELAKLLEASLGKL